ncbi:UNVERIFIED_CONTAM: protein yippee-like [Sesamum angustifolium]|uniref:Protein yippee-like n=1 Tax=Sesamum angustifolium TaxID=2727405 RepID=A0AAW2PUQ5_9LAMI
MGRVFEVTLEGKIYSCKHCGTHLALAEDRLQGFLVRHTLLTLFSLLSLLQSFHSRHGKAYLFNKVVNVTLGEKEERLMMTGSHIVSDIFCVRCGSIVGWKYETAHEKSQKYKEGKSVLERFKISGPDGSHYWVSHGAHVGGSDADDA